MFMKNYETIRRLVRLFLEKRDIIGEPDLTNKDERDKEIKSKKKNREEKSKKPDEASFGGVPGATTPLGTGPTYPAKLVKKHKKRKK